MKIKKPAEILSELITQYESMREFSRAIGEDSGDVARWKTEQRKIHPRAVINICRLHPDINPYLLNPGTFPEDLRLQFGE